MLYSDNRWRYPDIQWEYKFCWLPERCRISKKRMWLKMGYCGVLIKTGPGDPIAECRWHDPEEHLIWLLKGN